MSYFERGTEGNLDINEALIKIRAEIGTLPDMAQPTEEHVQEAVDKMYADQTESVKNSIVTAFLKSEAEAEQIADEL